MGEVVSGLRLVRVPQPPDSTGLHDHPDPTGPRGPPPDSTGGEGDPITLHGPRGSPPPRIDCVITPTGLHDHPDPAGPRGPPPDSTGEGGGSYPRTTKR